jgi:hypothetical protein
LEKALQLGILNQKQEESKTIKATTDGNAPKLSRYSASLMQIEVVSVSHGGDESQLGYTFYCLASKQNEEENKKNDENNNLQQKLEKNIETGNKNNNKNNNQNNQKSFVLDGCMKDTLTIGRSKTNQIVLKDESISKQHCILQYVENKGFFNSIKKKKMRKFIFL